MLIYLILIIFILVCAIKFKRVLKLNPFNFKGYQELKREVGVELNSKIYISTFVCFVVAVLLLTYFLEIQVKYWPLSVMVASLVYPFMWVYHYQYLNHEREFNDLVNYLQHFISCYKNIPLVYYCLKECQSMFKSEMNGLIHQAITKIEAGVRIDEALSIIGDKYPHFIVANLHTLVNSIETHGAKEYLSSLDLLLQDTDDLIEDVSLFKVKQKKMKTRMYLLIALSLGMSYFIKYMVSQIDIDVTSVVYQYSCLNFIIILVITFLLAQRVEGQKWISSKEEIC